MLRILAMLMKVKVEKREITKNYYSNFVRKTEEDLKDLNKMIEREKEEAEEVKFMINVNFFKVMYLLQRLTWYLHVINQTYSFWIFNPIKL